MDQKGEGDILIWLAIRQPWSGLLRATWFELVGNEKKFFSFLRRILVDFFFLMSHILERHWIGNWKIHKVYHNS